MALLRAAPALHHPQHLLRVVGCPLGGGRVRRRRHGGDRLLERAQRVDDGVHRVVDLVGDAGHQPPHRGELLRPDEVVLGAAELFQRVVQLGVALLEHLGAAPHLPLEVDVQRLGRAQLVAQRPPHLLEGERQPADFVRLARGRHRAGQLAARHLVRPLLEGAHRTDHVAHDEHHQPELERQRQADRAHQRRRRPARRHREQHRQPRRQDRHAGEEGHQLRAQGDGRPISATGSRCRAPSWPSSGRSTSRRSSVS